MFPSRTRLIKSFGMFLRTLPKSPAYSSQNHLPLWLAHLQNSYIEHNFENPSWLLSDVDSILLANPTQTSFAPTKMVINFQSFFMSMICECCITIIQYVTSAIYLFRICPDLQISIVPGGT